jgi:hypothetical protein
VKLSLAAALKGCSMQDIGISPDHIPAWLQTSLPLSLIRPQLSSGKVGIRLADILRGLDPEMRHLLAPARPDLEVVLPANELFHALPVGSAPEPAAPVPAAETMPPVARPEAQMPAGVPWPFKSVGAEGPETAAPVFPLAPSAVGESHFQPFAPAAPQPAAAPEPTAKTEDPKTESLFQPFTPMAPQPAAAPEPARKEEDLRTESPIQSFPPPTAGSVFPPPFASQPSFPAVPSAAAETPRAAPAPPAAAVVRPILASVVPQAPAPMPVPVSVVRPAIVPRPSSKDPDKRRQMLLRVLLGSQDDAFDAEGVIRLTTAQPGVAAAVCFNDGKAVASAGNGSPEADNFQRQAQRMLEHIQPLVELTGIDDTETVSVKSDRHVITFSLQGQVTLAVLHDPHQQEPTLREKVTLIARELTGLLQAA